MSDMEEVAKDNEKEIKQADNKNTETEFEDMEKKPSPGSLLNRHEKRKLAKMVRKSGGVLNVRH